MNTSSPHEAAPLVHKKQSPSWRVNLLYDSDCPLCVREVNFLRQQDKGRGLVKFTDIADDDYSPAENGGIDFETAMGQIHAVRPDGTVITHVEVFRQVYDILGIGWIYAPTRWPIIGPIVDWLYDIWANWRLALTGRPSLKTIVAERQKRQVDDCNDRCHL
jgi:predicted DCC family thiol-disulfide oxidoreductase YuxK